MESSSEKYQKLQKSFRNTFPFKLATTSFIYPDDYINNVRMLAPHFDEIELLFLESNTNDSLPSTKTIMDLKKLSEYSSITYNVHLPIDLQLGATNDIIRHHSLDRLKKVIDKTISLSASTMTLHLNRITNIYEGGQKNWIKVLIESLTEVLDWGIPSQFLSIETLDYPFHWVENIVVDMNLSVCMDIGHLLLSSADIGKFYHRYKERITIMHLHGVIDSKDHQPLDCLKTNQLKKCMDLLSSFRGIVSLEVFSFDHLVRSVNCLVDQWDRYSSK